jgi:hypothetical protein
MNAHPVLLQKKYARVVELFSEQADISLEEALDFFYHSRTYDLMSNGIADMHCRSDGYLCDELCEEFRQDGQASKG